MSKVDSQRAMREAKYARTQASGRTRREVAAAGRPPAAPAPATASTHEPAPTAPESSAEVSAETAAETAAAPQADHCGHKSMNGRACTREAGHAEKNHRYG